MSGFVHLHVHSEFSVLDGMATVDEYATRAKRMGQPSLAITDHGTLCGAPRFYHACRHAGVEPILGCEFYFVDDAEAVKQEKNAERCHVVILARGLRGYEILTQLSTASHRAFYYKPLIDKNMIAALGDDAQHLVCLSGCAASEISQAIIAGEMEKAEDKLLWWREMFPHFYVELQHHDTEFDRKLNAGLMVLSRRYKIPHVITNDPHYAFPKDAGHHDKLLAIQTAADLDDPNRFRFDGRGYWLKSQRAMEQAFADYSRTIWQRGAKNTLAVAQMCATRIPQWESRTWQIPRYSDDPDAPPAFRMLRKLSYAGMRARGHAGESEYERRLSEELNAIKQAGIADFLLITRECIEYAKSVGIPVGPGRGSVCGTLVGYYLGIHKIDPVRYHLMFERFLNIARPRMPDIDTDFGPTRRSEMFDFVAERYGEDNVVHVAAYQNMLMKSAFRSLAKSYGVSYPDTNRLAATLPDGLPEEGEAIDFSPEFRAEVIERFPDLWETLVRLSGLKRAVSAHPAGVIIASPESNIRAWVPEMYLASSKRFCGQYDLDAVEEMGLMKQDFLGLRTLETIAECVDLIEWRTGERLDPDGWVPDEEPDDDEVYAALARGECAGVFQMEGPTNAAGIRAIQPTCFEDIVSCTSLYRTGPISAGFPDVFLANRHGGEIEYVHPALEPILDSTWGVVLYQEQVMEMGEVIAGFSMEQVDDIKEAIKHKRSALMDSMGPLFIQGAMATVGATRAQAAEMWRMIEGYSGYGYNRSHAVAYSFTTYQTARLKCLYPAEFTVALLRTVEPKKPNLAKRQSYLADAARQGMVIRPAHINRSGVGAAPVRGGLRFGLTDVAGIGPKAAQRLVEGRPEGGYGSVEEVEAVLNNVRMMKVLADAHVLRPLGIKGNARAMETLYGWQFHDPLANDREDWAESIVRPGQEDDDSDGQVRLVGEIIARREAKTKNDQPYLTIKIRWDPATTWDVRLWSSTKRMWKDLREGAVVKVEGLWEPTWSNVSIADGRALEVLRPAKRTHVATVERSAKRNGRVLVDPATPGPVAVGRDHPRTSWDAAHLYMAKKGTEREKIAVAMYRYERDGEEPQGLHAYDLYVMLGLRSPNQTNTRLGELRDHPRWGGWVEKLLDADGEPMKRITEGENHGELHVLTEAGFREMQRREGDE